MIDLLIKDIGNGGDTELLGNDLATTSHIQNMIYLAFFGGNIEQSTNNTIISTQNLDWWGNNLLMPSDKSIQFNSETERVLNNTPLTSAGRVLIENAMKKDLEFFKEVGTIIDVIITIVDTDRLDTIIRFQELDKAEIVFSLKLKKAATGDWFILDFNNDFYFGQ